MLLDLSGQRISLDGQDTLTPILAAQGILKAIHPRLAVSLGELWFWTADRGWYPLSGDDTHRLALEALSLCDVSAGVPLRVTPLWVREVAWALPLMVPNLGDIPPPEFIEDPSLVIQFQDGVLDVLASARAGSPVFHRIRTPLLTSYTIRAVWGDGSWECPVWDRCEQEWSDGDESWVERRERVMGYTLLPTRRLGKAVLEFGRTQSGKGSGTNDILRHILPPQAIFSRTVDQVIQDFGLNGIQYARVWVTPEIRDLEHGVGQQFAAILKAVIGRDVILVNRKYRTNITVSPQCLPILQSNGVPIFPDDGGSITSKIIGIPFRRSFTGPLRDHTLPDKLRREAPSVAVRLAHAAIRLVASGWEFPTSPEATDTLEMVRTIGNEVDAFVEWAFTADPTGVVTKQQVLAQRQAYEQAVGSKLVGGNGRPLPYGFTLIWIERGTSWNVTRTYKNGEVALRGLRVKGVVPSQSTPSPEAGSAQSR